VVWACISFTGKPCHVVRKFIFFAKNEKAPKGWLLIYSGQYGQYGPSGMKLYFILFFYDVVQVIFYSK